MLTRQQCNSSDPCSGFSSTDNGCLSSLKDGQVGSSKFSLLSEAGEALVKMYQAMPEDVKSDLKISDSYRPLKIQCNIFDFDYFESTGKRRKKGTANVAVAKPGTSNHGWGRALDLSAKKAQDWIRENGSKYGWCWGEVKSEPWHFTFCGPGPNRYKMCDSMCKEKMDISVSSSSTETQNNTNSQNTQIKNSENKQTGSSTDTSGDKISTIDLLGGGALTKWLDTFAPKKDQKSQSNDKNEKEQVTEEIDRIKFIIKKVL